MSSTQILPTLVTKKKPQDALWRLPKSTNLLINQLFHIRLPLYSDACDVPTSMKYTFNVLYFKLIQTNHLQSRHSLFSCSSYNIQNCIDISRIPLINRIHFYCTNLQNLGQKIYANIIIKLIADRRSNFSEKLVSQEIFATSGLKENSCFEIPRILRLK